MNPLQLLRLKSIFGSDPTINSDPSNLMPPDMTRFDESGQPTYGSNPSDRPIPSMAELNVPNIPFGQTPPIQAPPNSEGNGMNDIAARMAQLYHPETDNIDLLNETINKYPTREHPSVKRRVGGAILGGLTSIGSLYNGSADTGRSVYDDVTGKTRYDEDVKDWNNKIKPIESAANTERQNNSNERQMAYQTISEQLRSDALVHKQNNDEVKAGIAQQRADIYAYKATHPNVKFDFSGTTIKVTDPATGQVTDTGIETGKMSQLDKMNLAHENKIVEQTHAGEVAKEVKQVIPGKNTTPTQPVNKPMTPTQSKMDQTMKANNIKNTRPDLAPFITIQGNGLVSIGPGKTPGSWSKTNPTPAQVKEINELIGATSSSNTNTQVKDPKREQAIKVLTDAKKPVTEANIKHVMDQIK